MKRLALGLLLLLTLTACGFTNAQDQFAASSEGAPVTADAAPSSAVQPMPQVIRTGYLTVRSDEPAQSALQAQAIVASVDGTIERSAESVYDGEVNVNMNVRVPASSFDTVMNQLADLGTLENKEVSQTDVTTQVLDLDARIAALETSVQRMTELLEQAESVGDLIAAEAALAERQGQLDSLVSQRDYLSEQVEMSSIALFIRGPSSGGFPSWFPIVGAVLIGVLVGAAVGATTGILIGASWSKRRRQA